MTRATWIGLLGIAAPALADDLRSVTYAIERPGAEPLQVRATWPEGSARLPVIVFSHGLGGSRDAYQPLVRRWAERGYLVLQPTHPDSLALATPRERLAAVRDLGAFVRDPASVASWDERPREVSLVLDHLGELGAAGLDPARIDRERTGIGGHSFGAHTSMVCGGLAPGGRSGLAEPRADALLLLSPEGPTRATPASAYAAITLPTLAVTGSEDRSPRTGLGPEWRIEGWDALGSAERWLLVLDGAGHTLGGISGRRRSGPDPADAGTLEAVLDATTTFWDATLRGDETARARLDALPESRRPPAVPRFEPWGSTPVRGP